MIDLHTHILPGVDDGAEDLDESEAMVRRAFEAGTTTLVATPHVRHERFWNDDRALLEERFAALVERVAERVEASIELHLGGEVALSSQSLAEIQRLPDADLPTLGGGRWLLVELDWRGLGPDPEDVLHEIQVVGHRALVAHPERVRWLMDDDDRLADLVAAGARVQLTAQSLVGDLGAVIEGLCRDLIDRGLVHCVASDTHDPDLRPPGLDVAWRYLEEHWSEEVARALLVENPRRILDDAEPEDVVAPAVADDRRGMVRRLFGGRR